MGKHSLRYWGKGLALSAGYCGLFLILWRHSLDQWYLPAGLRLAGVLLLHPRYWPFIAAGDAAALLVLRAPKSEQYSVQWAYLSPFLFMPVYSLAPLALRAWLKTPSRIASWLPFIAVIVVCWSTSWSMVLNHFLMGPRSQVTLQNFMRFTAGDFLGIMMIVLPCILWIRRKEWRGNGSEIAQNSAISCLMIAALFATSSMGSEDNSAIQLLPLVFMVLPVFFLTVMHGWHGAALGIVLVNLAVAFALPRPNVQGAHSEILFIAQITLAVLNIGLLIVGDRISRLFELSTTAIIDKIQAVRALRIEQDSNAGHSKNLLKTIFRSNDLQLREKALMIGAARHNLDNYRYDVAQSLKEDGQYERAMEALATGMQAAKTIDLQRDTLYPLEIETHGLYAALMGPAFHDAWRQHARVYQNFSGDQHYLSITLRLAVYRAIFRAMESMQDYAPNEYDIRARVWRRRGRAGVTVLITCSATREPEALSQNAQDAFDELRARVFAFDGVHKRRHPCRIRFMMTEAIPAG